MGHDHLGSDWRFRVAPVINGYVIPALALLPSSHVPLPDQDFEQEWRDHIDLPFMSSETAKRFYDAFAACVKLSAIIACRDFKNLHSEEDDVVSKSIESFKRNLDFVTKSIARAGPEHIERALDYLDQAWHQVVSESESAKAGNAVGDPLCMTIHHALAGHQTERAAELAAARMLLLQAECVSQVDAGGSQITETQ